MTRVLLTGAGGQLGTDVVLASGSRPSIELVALDREGLDVADPDATSTVIADAAPEVIVHCAAYTAVDRCESDEAAAEAVNATGTHNVADAAAAVGARLISLSTDYVFDGAKSSPYLEGDRPNPHSVYGLTKLVGEQATRALGDSGLVVRTSWVCGRHGANMVKTILRLADTHDTLTFVDDQIGKPTFTHDLAEVLLDLAEHGSGGSGSSGGGHAISGVLHVTNEGVVSWYEFCREVLAAAGLDPDRVNPCSTEALQPPRPAPRPANSVLANTRFADLGLPLLRDFREPLAEVVRDLTS